MKIGPVLRQRCPRCLRGPVFGGLFRMLETCPECGLRFEREQGYFVGAMYYAYALSIAAGTPPVVAGWLAGWSTAAMVVGASSAVVLLSPLSFRISRVVWLHMDQGFDPR